MDKLQWWHSVPMPDGTTTKGVHNYETATGDRYLFPDVNGKTVLDIGCFDGYWSARAIRNKAKSVIAVDRHILPTCKLVLEAYGFKYENWGDINKTLWGKGKFDVVLFYGVVYHLFNPVQGIMNAIKCVAPGGTLIIESACNQINTPDGFCLFNADDWDGDDTNYFMPSISGLENTIKVAFKILQRDYQIIRKQDDGAKTRITFEIICK
jgi:tRNA (mo5U34)-methyltransferase